jgi:hypothetical protein
LLSSPCLPLLPSVVLGLPGSSMVAMVAADIGNRAHGGWRDPKEARSTAAAAVLLQRPGLPLGPARRPVGGGTSAATRPCPQRRDARPGCGH